MLISDSTARALENVTARERDLLKAVTPDPLPQWSDPPPASLPSDTYFVTRDGAGRLLFTGNGSFRLNEGTLVDAAGNPMMGRRSAQGELSALRANPIDLALGVAQNVRIEPDGSVTYDRSTVDPRSGTRDLQRVTLGRLAVARFPAGTRVGSRDGSSVTAPAGIAPLIGLPGDGNFARLGPFSREQNSIELDTGLQRLQEAYLALDALRAANAAQGSLQKTTMDLLT